MIAETTFTADSKEADDIKGSLVNVLNELFGSTEGITNPTEAMELTRRAIELYEPRIEVTDVSFAQGDNVLNIGITFTIKSDNSKHQVNYPYYY